MPNHPQPYQHLANSLTNMGAWFFGVLAVALIGGLILRAVGY